ncbi:MAG: guanylate kinase [Nitrospinaceae bacterium]
MKQEGITFILSAPSGTGKTTTCHLLREKLPNLKFSVSHTTRPPRNGEVDGEDYFFISEDEFKKKIERGEFLEWARVHNHHYGTAMETVTRHRNNGDNLLLEMDVQGVESLRKMNFPGVYLFIVPPSLEELSNRLKGRGTETEEGIRKRIEVGKNEIRKYGLYDFVLTNFHSFKTANTICAIIEAENCRVKRYKPTSPDLEELLNEKADL